MGRPSAITAAIRERAARRLIVKILHDTGIEVRSATESFQADGVKFAAGSWVMPASQPYRAHLKDMMERQVYPNRLTAGGKAEPPYDVAGWTLPLQMGVQVVALSTPLEAKTARLDSIEAPRGGIDEAERSQKPDYYAIANTTNDAFLVRNRLMAAGIGVYLHTLKAPARSEYRFAANEKSRAVLDKLLPAVSTTVKPGYASDSKERSAYGEYIADGKVWLYQPWMPSMDEGWTRLVLESFEVPYRTIHNAEIRAGGLGPRDVLLIPSIEAKTLRNGFAANESEPAYVGGLGQEGADAIGRFVRGGGRLVCLDASCEYAIDELDLPVKNVLKGVSTAEFYAPGSILRATVPKRDSEIILGVPEEISVYFDHSRAFDASDSNTLKVLARYAKAKPLESGWLLGPSKLEGKAALVEIGVGDGEVVLFGFPPQHRGQTHGTFRLLFNALQKN